MIMIIISYVPEMYRLQPTELCLVCLLRARVVASVCQRRELKKKICSVAPTKKRNSPSSPASPPPIWRALVCRAASASTTSCAFVARRTWTATHRWPARTPHTHSFSIFVFWSDVSTTFGVVPSHLDDGLVLLGTPRDATAASRAKLSMYDVTRKGGAAPDGLRAPRAEVYTGRRWTGSAVEQPQSKHPLLL